MPSTARPRSRPSSRPSSAAEGESHESFESRHRRSRAGAAARQQRARVPHAARRASSPSPAASSRSSAARATGIPAAPRRSSPTTRPTRSGSAPSPCPPGSWEYKAPLNGSWDENYGANATPGGANIALNLPAARSVKFYYDHETHWITDNVTSTIAVAPGSFQSELGCPGDWDPELPPLLAAGSGRERHVHLLDDGAAGGELRGQGRDQRELGRELRRGRHARRREHPVHGHAPARPSPSPTSRRRTSSSISVVAAGPGHDGNVEWDGLRHDSRDPLYRTPGGAVPAGHAGDAAAAHLPRRRHLGRGADLRRQRERAADPADGARRRGRVLLRRLVATAATSTR